MRSGNDANIDVDIVIAADPLEASLLQDPEKHYLHFRWEFSDFIEENRSAVGEFKTPQAALQCAGKRTFFMTKQLRSNERLGYGSAIN